MANNIISNYLVLARSPLVLAPIIDAFFQAYPAKQKSMLVGYLVLPVVLYPPAGVFLKNSNVRSTLRTFCSDNSRLLGLQQRVMELNDITSLAIQNSLDCSRLLLGKDLSVTYNEDLVVGDVTKSNESEAARKLARLLEPYDVPTVFRILGVKGI